MRLIASIFLIAGCTASVPCDSIVSYDEEEYSPGECIELDFDPTQFTPQRVVVGLIDAGSVEASVTPALLAAGQSAPFDHVSVSALVNPMNDTYAQTSNTITFGDGVGEWVDRAVVFGSDANGAPATAVVDLSYVDRNRDSYYLGDVKFDSSAIVEQWGAAMCVRLAAPDKTTYFVTPDDWDCDGIPNSSDSRPLTYDAP